jgi:hypothetical protein
MMGRRSQESRTGTATGTGTGTGTGTEMAFHLKMQDPSNKGGMEIGTVRMKQVKRLNFDHRRREASSRIDDERVTDRDAGQEAREGKYG